MLYPLKFRPVYKSIVWGGRNLEKLGKTIPDGKIGESWEISCHPDGVSTVDNGEYAGMPLDRLVEKLGRDMIGTGLPHSDVERFPLLVKFIDANDRLSVQVHPDDEYAGIHENGGLGKNEMWYIISAEPGAKLVYDVMPGTDRKKFAQAIKDEKVEDCLKFVEVAPGDVLNIPAGMVHAIGKGIVLAEIQQSSNTTYRVYDYNRTDSQGSKRALHIDKALDVIDFNAEGRKEKSEGLRTRLSDSSSKINYVANQYFSVELYDIGDSVSEAADGSKFFIFVILEGEGSIVCDGCSVPVKGGESVLIPAALGNYTLSGSFKALKAYVPDISKDVLKPLTEAGFSRNEIIGRVSGLDRISVME